MASITTFWSLHCFGGAGQRRGGLLTRPAGGAARAGSPRAGGAAAQAQCGEAARCIVRAGRRRPAGAARTRRWRGRRRPTEVMRQVNASGEMSKQVGPFLRRDRTVEEAVNASDEEKACAGHACPDGLLEKLTEAVAAIVNDEVRSARCEPMSDDLHSFVAWLLEGAQEKLCADHPGYLDVRHLAFYAAHYEEPPPTLPPSAGAEYKGATRASSAAPQGAGKGGNGTCAHKQELSDEERERQKTLVEELLEEYQTLSEREQTRVHSVYNYLESQLRRLQGNTSEHSTGLQPSHAPPELTSEEGELLEIVTVPEVSMPLKVDITQQPVIEESIGEIQPSVDEEHLAEHIAEGPVEQTEEEEPAPQLPVEAEPVPMPSDEGESHHEHLRPETQPPVDQATESEEVLIEKDLALLGLGNGSTFSGPFNTQSEEEPEEEVEEEEDEVFGEETEGRKRKRKRKRGHAGAHAKIRHDYPRRLLRDQFVDDTEERGLLRSLVDNQDATDARRR